MSHRTFPCRGRSLAAVLALLCACSSSPPRTDGRRADGARVDLADATAAGEAARDAGAEAGIDRARTHECQLLEAQCLAWNQRRFCQDGASGRRWVEETCAAGSGCVKGQCQPQACSDECDLGDSAAGKTCALFSMATQSFVPLDPALRHDRARAFTDWLHRDAMAHGGVGSVAYADPPTYQKPSVLRGLGDSAIWTGTYLAAEALRLKATGSPAARASVKKLVQTLHLWFNVSGTPGMLARFASPAGVAQPVLLEDLKCGKEQRVHCNVSYLGAAYDYIGHISRDQYQGVMLGYALAYEALAPTDEQTRALIRDDVMELVEELMKERTLQVKITFNGTVLPAFPVKLRFAVEAPAEMDSGAIVISINTSAVDDAVLMGFQEFIPNMSDLLKQMPLLGALVPPVIQRASSAIMLASFFRVALLVSDGIPALAARRAAIETFYRTSKGWGGNLTDWLAIAKLWTGGTSCGKAYYANNITMEPMYNLARLETDAAARKTIVDEVLAGLMWPVFKTTKNSFFSFIYAANLPGAPKAEIDDAVKQLDGFKAPPRVVVPVDHRSDPKYLPHEPGCTDQVVHTTSVDVADRPIEDFMWQRHPWALYHPGDLHQTEPGVDYLVAYWMGRQHGFITEDAPGRCLRWK